MVWCRAPGVVTRDRYVSLAKASKDWSPSRLVRRLIVAVEGCWG